MNIFLYAPDDFKNLCVISRSLDCFGVNQCFVYDPNKLIRSRYGKSYSNRIQTVSAGAFFHITWEVVQDPYEFIKTHAGRRIVTSPRREAVSIYRYPHIPSDLIIFGSERNGVPDDIRQICDMEITIPLTGQTQSLNLSISVSIVLAEISRRIEII
jgi:tRNA G18 (ribose-2'-O)-methylase SpoU